MAINCTQVKGVELVHLRGIREEKEIAATDAFSRKTKARTRFGRK